MTDFAVLHKEARHDIRMCLQSWIEVLRDELGDRIDYVYSKGSSMKNWDSPIDYVPVVSDVDIHILLKDDEDFFYGCEERFDAAMRLSQRFEDRFFELEPEPLHFPRSQLIHVNRYKNEDSFVMPRVEDVQPLIGHPPQEQLPSNDTIRQIDLKNLMELEEYIQWLPMGAMDRAGFDFWSLIRRMLWRVSPSPVRVITQTHDNAYEVWNWNRTKLSAYLLEMGLDEIEKFYREFYMAGWRLFISGYTSRADFRGVAISGYYLLKRCHEYALNL
ncbi:MAG: hypothetical protein ACXADC_13580 [Candidatus Thorarchaeota archaeon]|jgi:hypothetical protein